MKKLGLVGYPLSHSYSKRYFDTKFVEHSLDGFSYELFPIEHIEEINTILTREPDLIGFNVTIPYKESVISYLHEMDKEAEQIGAVNCVKVIRNEDSIFLKGFNTDVFGFRQCIKPFLAPFHNKALIIGNGGSAKAVAKVLNDFGIPFWFVGRKNKGESNFIFLDKLENNMIDACKLIVNTTPIGMYPDINASPVLPVEAIGSNHLVIDLIYNPSETLFLSSCKERGATCLNGLSMFYHQADKSWEIWNG